MKGKNTRNALSCQEFRAALSRVVQETRQSGRLSTATNYCSAAASFFSFLEQTEEDFRLESVIFVRYEHWLRSKGLLRNSTSFYMRNLRAMCRALKGRGTLKNVDFFGGVYTGVDNTRKRAVAESVIARVKRADLSAEPILAYYRDLFLFCFYCRGMSFVDLAYLRTENIRDGYIRYSRRKTGRTIEIHIEKCMTEIMARYPGQLGYVFPIITTSDSVKAYRQYRSAICVFNRMLKRLAERLGVPVFSSYASRHTWATIARDKQVPLSVISESMGHSSEAVTRIYLASFSQQVIDEANKSVIDI